MLRAALALALATLAAASCAEPVATWMAADWDEPAVFAPGIISTDDREYGITFTPDGREAYFTRRGRRGPSIIMVTHFQDGEWSNPRVAEFATEWDEAPFISADGDTMLFVSRRPMQGSWDRSENIWVMERREDGWSEPEPLPGTINQPEAEIDDFDVGTESGPTLLPDGTLLYWTRASPDWGSDIYVAEPDDEGAYGSSRPLRLNTSREESHAALSPDGRYLIFQGYGTAGGYGDDDLYASRRTEYGWSRPEPLPSPINTIAGEGHPAFSPDGRLFFFSSDRGGGFDDIYVVSTDALGLSSDTP